MRSRASAVLSSDVVNKAAAAAAAESTSRTTSQQSSPLTSPGVSPRSDGEGDSTPRRTRRSAVLNAQEAGAAWLGPASTSTTPGVSPLTNKRLSPRAGHESGSQPMSPHALLRNASGNNVNSNGTPVALVNNPSSPTQQSAHVRPVPGTANVSTRALPSLQQGSPRALRSNSTAGSAAPRPSAHNASLITSSSSAITKLQARPGATKAAGASSAAAPRASLTASAGAIDTLSAMTSLAPSTAAPARVASTRYDNTTVRRTLKPGALAAAANRDLDDVGPNALRTGDLLSELEEEYADSDEFLASVSLDSNSTSMYLIGPDDDDDDDHLADKTVDMTSEIIIQPRWKSTKPSRDVVKALETLLLCDDEAFDRANDYFAHTRKTTRPELYASHGQRDAKETFYLANEFATPEEIARMRAGTSQDVINALEQLDEQIFARSRVNTDVFQSLTSAELNDTMEFVIAEHMRARNAADATAAARTETFERLRDRVWTMTAPPLLLASPATATSTSVATAAPMKPLPAEPPSIHDKAAYRDYMALRLQHRRMQRESFAPRKPLPPTPEERK